MKKPYSYREMSDQFCATPGCDRLIKKSVVVRFGYLKNLLCYGCFKRQKKTNQSLKAPARHK